MISRTSLLAILAALAVAEAWQLPKLSLRGAQKSLASAAVAAALLSPCSDALAAGRLSEADKSGASTVGQTKVAKGAASTQGFNSGSVKTITRGAALDGSNFQGQNLKGVSFQQSLVRNTNFKDAQLQAASFFDADLSFADMTDAQMNQANLELACLDNTIFRNAVVTEAYVSGATKINEVDIENSDWTDTVLRKGQKLYLCTLPSAKGTNTFTGVDTRDSLLCDL